MAEEKREKDWELAERLYRAGQLSNVQIAKQIGCTEGALRKRAKKEGWKKDLTKKVQQAVRAELVRGQGTSPHTRVRDPRTEREIVEEAVTNAVSVVRDHQSTLKRAGSVMRRLFEQLDDSTANSKQLGGLIEQAMDVMIEQADSLAERSVLERQKVRLLDTVSLPGYAQTLRELSNAAKNFITAERTTWGLDQGMQQQDSIESMSDEELEALELSLRAQMQAELNAGRGNSSPEG